MKYFLATIFILQSVVSWANPSCLYDKTCFEYNGKIIDIKPNYLNGVKLSSLPTETPILDKREFSRIIGEQKAEYFIPVDINGTDLAILAGALSLGTVVFANDREVMDFVVETKEYVPESVGPVGFFLGGRQGIPLIAGGSYFMGAVVKNGKLKNIGIIAVYTGLATQIVTDAFKNSLKRNRPNFTDDPYAFDTENKSMFSGHASGAFSMATVISEVYKDKPLVPYVAYGLAAVVSYSRVYENKHWATDVMGGAVIGHLVTKIMMRTFANSERMSGTGIIVTPNYGQTKQGDFQSGLNLEWRGNRKPRDFECTKHELEGSTLIETCMDEIFERSKEIRNY